MMIQRRCHLRVGQASPFFLLLLVPWLILAQQPVSKKHPIFIIPGFAASTLTGDFTFPGAAPGSTLDPQQLEALLLASASKSNSQKLDSSFFSVQDSSAEPAAGDGSDSKSSKPAAGAAAAAAGAANSTGTPAPAAAANATANVTAGSNQTDTSGSASAAKSAAKPPLPPKEAAAAAAKAAALASGCPHMSLKELDVWLPSSALASLAPLCLRSLLAVRYKQSAAGSASFVNNTNTNVSVYQAGEGGTLYPLFSLAGYNRLVEYIERQLGYQRGVDLFVLPYDFRLDPSSMKSSGQLQGLARQISHRVAVSKRKAIIIGHSTGAVVGLQLLQEPNVRKRTAGFIALAAPFGGSASSLLAHISGAFDFSVPWLATTLPAALGSSDISKEALRQWLFNMTRGMPSVASMMPYAEAFGANHVAVTVGSPQATYTVSEVPKLLAAIKETTLADTYATTHTVASMLRPLPGVQTFCIYGSSSDTPKAWLYSKPLLAGQPNEMPTVAQMGKGDGLINLESLRLCRSIATSPRHVSELPAITHHSVHTKRASLKVVKDALDAILRLK